ncbi:hypothetical protein EYM_07390 [Ignicoccus islandicus DSM 13165]|uniref:RNase NYN domain-containing protein n=1 Tax=Ignicoccus islandicus DSM 13165 TaxID=940295 RepID=A0A0U3F9S1_9CREN|nr:hypothetical protein [Ignicoccus islandicus]ALU12776.1 hypothetical protein EYM_07390 [Ignicoccus islandicus DSM 13165]
MIEIVIAALIASLTSILYITAFPYLKRLIERKRENQNIKIKVPQNVAVLDISNIALYGEKKSKKGSIERALIAIKTLEERGFKVIAIADASLRHKIDKPDKLDKLIELGRVIQAPPNTPADYFILATAENEYGIVISNDSFKEWRERFPWVKDKRRVIRYLIIDGRMYLYPDVRPKKKWKDRTVRTREICIDLEEVQEGYWKNYVM